MAEALRARPDATGLRINVSCPSLVLCGREDTWSPVFQHEEISAQISGSRLEIVPDCGHMSTLERPETVSEALREWPSAVSRAA